MMSLIILAISFSGSIGNQLLVAAKRQKEYTISVFVGATINVVLNLILITNLKSFGATIATVIAEFSVTAIQFYFVRKDINIKDTILMSKNYIISGLGMFIVCKLIDYGIANNIVALICQILIGCLTYMGILYILKDNFFKYILEIVKNKLKI